MLPTLPTEFDDHETLEELIAAEPAAPALPGVYAQPVRRRACRGRCDVEAALRLWTRAQVRREPHALHEAQRALEDEHAPLIAWALECWDFLLTTEGCRFLLRKEGERWGARGDYRACTAADYHRLVIRVFRDVVARYAAHAGDRAPLTAHLAETLWPAVREAYRALSQPPDVRQRRLTAYSYLRCVPYQFMHESHQTLITMMLPTLPVDERRSVDGYFLHFLTETATAEAARLSVEQCEPTLHRALQRLHDSSPLAAALLRQIARY